MKNRFIRYADYLFAFIVLYDLVTTGLVASIALRALSDYLGGWNLIGIITQNFLYFSLGIAVIITFVSHHRTVKWFLLIFVAVIFLSSQINWTLNKEFLHPEIPSRLDQMLSSLNLDISGIYTLKSSKMKINTHPNWSLKFLYVIGLIYAFILRPFYNKLIQPTADSGG